MTERVVSPAYGGVWELTYTLLQVRQRIRSDLVNLAWIFATTGDCLDSIDIGVDMPVDDELDNHRHGFEEAYKICNLGFEFHNQRDALDEDGLD